MSRKRASDFARAFAERRQESLAANPLLSYPPVISQRVDCEESTGDDEPFRAIHMSQVSRKQRDKHNVRMKAGFEERMAVDGEEISERRSFVVHAVSHIPEKAPPKVAAVSADANDAPLDVPTSVKKWDWSHQPSQRIVVKSGPGTVLSHDQRAAYTTYCVPSAHTLHMLTPCAQVEPVTLGLIAVKGRKWNLLCPPETTGAAIMVH